MTTKFNTTRHNVTLSAGDLADRHCRNSSYAAGRQPAADRLEMGCESRGQGGISSEALQSA